MTNSISAIQSSRSCLGSRYLKALPKKQNKNALAYLIVYIPTPAGPRASNAYPARLPPPFFLVQSGARQTGPPLLLLLPAGGTAP